MSLENAPFLVNIIIINCLIKIDDLSGASQTGTNVKKDEQKAGTTLIDKESMETGSVSFKVYLYYMKYLGIFGVVLGITMQTFYQGCSIGTTYYIITLATEHFLKLHC